MQSKTQSLKESLTNVAIGYLISLVSLFVIFPVLGIQSSAGKNMLITLYFTAISVLRSYILRRYFNKKVINSTLCSERDKELLKTVRERNAFNDGYSLGCKKRKRQYEK